MSLPCSEKQFTKNKNNKTCVISCLFSPLCSHLPSRSVVTTCQHWSPVRLSFQYGSITSVRCLIVCSVSSSISDVTCSVHVLSTFQLPTQSTSINCSVMFCYFLFSVRFNHPFRLFNHLLSPVQALVHICSVIFVMFCNVLCICEVLYISLWFFEHFCDSLTINCC